MPGPHPETTAQAKLVVFFNRKAGGDKANGLEASLGNMFRTHGIAPLMLHADEGVDLRARLSGEDVADDAIVVAAGGDGTVSAVAAELVGTGRILGVLPLGTLNHFAKDLGIPLDLHGCVQTLTEGRVLEIDVGEVNGRAFVNNSSLGLYPQIVTHREALQEHRGSRKWPAFARATLTAVRRYPFLHLRVHLSGEQRTLKTPCVFVGNNEYEMQGLNLGGRACLNQGKLVFYLANRTGRFGLVRLAARALVGRLNQAKDFESFCTDEAWIESGKSTLLVATDGEVTRMTPPLHYRVRPGALRVLVPPEKGPG